MTETPTPQWDVTMAREGSSHLNMLLARGWEPFAVTRGGMDDRIWLRIKVFVKRG